jgi:hypothetical protein
MEANGRRILTGVEAQRRAKALSCLREKGSACQGQININVYFDGTGNNWDWAGTYIKGKTRSSLTQRNRNGHSNVARLYDAGVTGAAHGFFNIYIPGVGTPFDKVGDSSQDGDTLGGAAAKYGTDRINWAVLQIFNSIHVYLAGVDISRFDRAAELIREVGQWSLLEGEFRRFRFSQVADAVEQVVKDRWDERRVRSINVSVFGFSRGAAQARAFVHRLYESTEAWGSGCGYNIAGIPLYLNFLGMFDTVASVGLASMSRVSNGKWNWASGKMMSIHPEVRRAVHFAALHEQRINFPLDLADIGQEVLYPGMHSDVGGGYSPGGQGKDFVSGKADGTAKLSQIALIDMHHEAIKAGVFLQTREEISQDALLDQHFGCHPQLIRDYNAWLGGHGVAAGAHAQQIRNHATQYVAWKGKRLWLGPESMLEQPFYTQSDEEDRVDLGNAQRDFGKLVATLAQGKKEMALHRKQMEEVQRRMEEGRRTGRPVFEPSPRASPAGYKYAALPAETRALLDVVLEHTPVPECSAVLFDNYVHDSLAGFYMDRYTELNIPALNTHGYLRCREVFSVNGINPQECRGLSALPPGNVPSIGGAFQQLGMAMGG